MILYILIVIQDFSRIDPEKNSAKFPLFSTQTVHTRAFLKTKAPPPPGSAQQLGGSQTPAAFPLPLSPSTGVPRPEGGEGSPGWCSKRHFCLPEAGLQKDNPQGAEAQRGGPGPS